MKYRRKSQVIEAFQWLIGPEHPPGPKWFGDAVLAGDIKYQNVGTPEVRLRVACAPVFYNIASPGDYIVNLGEGKMRIQTQEFFEEAYERVEEKG